MLDPRFPPDTLFLTFEQDFSWYERDCLEVNEWLPMCVNTEHSEGAGGELPNRPGGADRPPADSEPAGSSAETMEER